MTTVLILKRLVSDYKHLWTYIILVKNMYFCTKFGNEMLNLEMKNGRIWKLDRIQIWQP